RRLLSRRRPARATCFPYTSLFRSSAVRESPSRAWVAPKALCTPVSSTQKVTAEGYAKPGGHRSPAAQLRRARGADERYITSKGRSEEHTSELQSRFELVCRRLLEK